MRLLCRLLDHKFPNGYGWAAQTLTCSRCGYVQYPNPWAGEKR